MSHCRAWPYNINFLTLFTNAMSIFIESCSLWPIPVNLLNWEILSCISFHFIYIGSNFFFPQQPILDEPFPKTDRYSPSTFDFKFSDFTNALICREAIRTPVLLLCLPETIISFMLAVIDNTKVAVYEGEWDCATPMEHLQIQLLGWIFSPLTLFIIITLRLQNEFWATVI